MTTKNFANFANIEQFEAAYKAGQDAFDTAYRSGKENARKVYENAADAAAKNWAQWIDATKGGVAKMFPQAGDAVNQAADLSRANLDAFFAASAIALKGAEALSDEIVAYGRKTAETNVDTLNKAAKCKSANDVIELQSKAARNAVESFTAEGQKISEMTVKNAAEAAEPIKTQLEQAFQKTAAKPAA